MSYYGSWKIDDALTFTCNTHNAASGSAAAASSLPTYRVYEDETATAIASGSMATLDAANTIGFYSEQITLSAANGYEKGKSYHIYIKATVGGITGTLGHNFQIEAEVDANTVSPSVVAANVTQLSGDATAADNAESFFDGTGYAGTNNVIPSVTTVTGNLNGTVGSLATQAKADVNVEVVDALNVDTYAEPGQGAPAATASLAAKINYLFKSWRNKKTQTATTRSLFNDAGDTVDQKATDSDDTTTFTKGEIGSGP